MRTVVATWYVKPGKLPAAREAAAVLAAEVESDEGVLCYLVHESAAGSLPPAAEGQITFLEVYADEAAFKAHLESRAYKQFLETAAREDVFVTQFNKAEGPFMLVSALTRIAGFTRKT